MPIELAESSDQTCKYATFLISVLDEYDRMGRMIPKEAGEAYHSTLRGFPVVAKLMRSRGNKPVDFRGHEFHKWVNRNGETEYSYGTYPIGSVIDTWIEDREVDGYKGTKSCIMAKAKLWTCRSPEYFVVLDRLWSEQKISSSWELIATDVEEQPLGKKILKVFSFIGNAILGTTSVPAVKGAGIYEYAECSSQDEQLNNELSEALMKDINTAEQEDNTLNEDEKKKMEEDSVDNPDTNEIPNSTDGTENPANTNDEEKNPEPDDAASCNTKDDKTKNKCGTAECKSKEDDKKKCGAAESDPEPEDEEGKLSQKVAELTDALMQANEIIQQLKSEIESFAPIKADYEKMAQEKAEAQKASEIAALTKMALDSKQITEAELAEDGGDEAVKALIANLDKAGLQELIVSRLISSIGSAKPTAKTELASLTDCNLSKIKRKSVITSDSNDVEGAALVRAYIND